MLTLQSTFSYADSGTPPVESSTITVAYPRLQEGTIFDEGDYQWVDYGKEYLTFQQNLSEKRYFTELPISKLFSAQYAKSVPRILNVAAGEGVQYKADINLLGFQISVNFGTAATQNVDNPVTFEVLHFMKTLKHPIPPPAPPVPHLVRDSETVPVHDAFSGTAELRSDITRNAVDENIYLINKTAYLQLLNQAFPDLATGNEGILLFLINLLVDLNGQSPQLDEVARSSAEGAFNDIVSAYGVQANATAYNIITQNFPKLFDFPLHMPKLEFLTISGFVKVTGPTEFELTYEEASFYHLSAEYDTAFEGSISPHVARHPWDKNEVIQENKINFAIKTLTPTGTVSSRVTVKLKDYNNVDQYNQSFDVTDKTLQNLVIEVNKRVPGFAGVGSGSHHDPTKKIRGKVVSLTKRCTLKGTVTLQAKRTSEGAWVTISSSASDEEGNFRLPYPYGNFVEAQVVTSLDSTHPTVLQLDTESLTETIPSTFLYILLHDEETTDKDKDPQKAKENDGCGCNNKLNAGRLPSQDDLVQSGQYTQDVGGSCVNLTTPNRSLREYNYNALVRHTDPDVANYELSSETDGSLTQAKTVYRLRRIGKVKRNFIDIDNPIKWEDVEDEGKSLTVYQSVTVATGHILYYKSEFRADGYSLGDLVYSLPLAPGQKREIVMIDSSRSFRGTETQDRSQLEQLASDLVNERDIADEIGGGLGERLAGRSDASTWGVSGGGGAAGTSGFASGNVGVAGGYAASGSNASQASGRDLSGHFQESIRQGIHQNASSYRQQHISTVTTTNEGQKYNAETTVVANHNHCHSLTMLYFQVLRHFAIYQELVNVEECVFVPFLLTKFGMENIPRWADVLSTRLLPLSSNTYLKLQSYVENKRAHPLISAFDALERVKTEWALVDYPVDTYAKETIIDVRGQGILTVHIPRPHTKYDFILSLPIVNQTISRGSGGGFLSFLKHVAIGPLAFFTGNNESQTIQVRAALFDQFMTMDPTFEQLPPARCIRVKNFQPVSIKDPNSPNLIWLDPIEHFSSDKTDRVMWDSYAQLLGRTNAADMMEYFFKDQLLSDWNRIWYDSVAPQIFISMVKEIRIDVIGTTYVPLGRYRGGEASIAFSFEGSLPKSRLECQFLNVTMNKSSAKDLDPTPAVFRLTSLRLAYSTPHFNGMLYNGSPNADLLAKGDVLDPLDDGVRIYCPLNAAEQRNPRQDDRFLTQRLIIHLNNNLEYYNRVVWFSLDEQRRFLLLDGFQIEIFDDNGQSEGFRSISSVVKSSLIAVIGNSLVFPVAPGYKVGVSFITTANEDGERIQESLLDHYKPDTPMAPYRLSVPTRGIYSEALMGQCDSCEMVKPDSAQDWTKFTADEPTKINPITPPVPTFTDYKPDVKDFSTPMVSIQNAPNLPDPGSGLNAALNLLGKSDLFKDITGLDANQQNAIKTLMSNNESARAYAQMASGMAMQAHNTANSPQMLEAMKAKKDEGAMDNPTYSGLIKSHFQQQIDGGASLRAELDQKKEAGKKTPIEAAADAGMAGLDASGSTMDSDGNVHSLKVQNVSAFSGRSDGGTSVQSSRVLGDATPPSVKLENQSKVNDCWACCLAMLQRWKKKDPDIPVLDILRNTLQTSVSTYEDIYRADTGLSNEPEDVQKFARDFGLTIEDTQQSMNLEWYAQLLNDYGPLWLIIDPDPDHDVNPPSIRRTWSNHMVVITKIWVQTYVTPGAQPDYFVAVYDPSKLRVLNWTAQELITQVERWVRDIYHNPNINVGQFNFHSVAHFKEKRVKPLAGGGSTGGQPDGGSPIDGGNP